MTQNLDSIYTEFSLGKLQTKQVSLKDIKKQTSLKYPKHLSLDSAYINLFIPSNHAVKSFSIHPNFDTIEYKRQTNELTIGSSVGIDFYLSDTNNNRKSKQTIHYVISTLESKPQAISENKQWKILKERTYLEGTIYISISSSHDLIVYFVKAGNHQELNKIFDRLISGSVLVFDKVSYKDKSGKTSFLNETITIE
ncbi:MAG: hypothetical protein JSR00_03300 [Bacteroidetes bacterium]|nr:hypothetical protein [Bacteroidota bacterium]